MISSTIVTLPTGLAKTNGAGTPVRQPLTPSTVLTEWTQSGPLTHEPTGIQALDDATGGGPVYGTRWYLVGAPDAGKTALLIQLAHTWAQRGIAVGLLAVDEEASDVVTRLAQRAGWARHHCEARDPAIIADMTATLADLPIRIYDATWTVEAAAGDLAQYAAQHGMRAMLGVDSIQTVRCDAEAVQELSEVAAVTARAYALRAVATQHRLIAIATSEMGRGAYRSSDPSQQTSTLAAGKWSGSIEYSARVLIGLRSVADEPDLIELDLAKNKHGPTGERMHLRIDRRAQTLSEARYEPPPAPDKSQARVATVAANAALVAGLLRASPSMSVRSLHSQASAVHGLGRYAVEAALAQLGDTVTRSTGPRGAVLLTLSE